jgi:hypothetical protein
MRLAGFWRRSTIASRGDVPGGLPGGSWTVAVLFAVVLSVPGPRTGTSAASSAEPLVIDGDPAITVVSGGGAVYVAGRQGLYRPNATSGRWTTAGAEPPDGRLVVAEDDPELLLAGDHSPCARGGGEPPILHRSGDGGASWQPVAGGEDVQPLAAWAVAGMSLGAGCDGLHLSVDGGATWNPLAVDLEGSEVTGFGPIRDGGDAPVGGLIATTSEGGTSRLWRLDLGDPTAPVKGPVLKEFWGVGAVVATGGTILLGTADGVWRSDDAGVGWTRQRTGLEAVTLADDPLVAGIPPEIEPNSFGVTALWLDPFDDDHVLAGTAGGVYISRDGGTSWDRLDGVDGPVVAVAVLPETGGILAESEDGVALLT